MKFKLLGTGSYLPTKVVTNDDLSKMVDTNDEWIKKRVGISSRHISEDETTSQMATKAALNSLENSGIKPEEIDLIIASTITADKVAPSVACTVQQAIGANCPAFDLCVACPGFIFALETAVAYMSMGNIHKVLVVSADRLSSIVDWQDRSTCIIFADGAGAVVISDEEDNYLSSVIKTKGDCHALNIPVMSGNSPFYKGEKCETTHIEMNGQETYKFAVTSMQHDIAQVLEKTNLTGEDIKWVVPHQANVRIINEAARKTGMDKTKFCKNIEYTGNTSSASVPILLDEINRAGKLEKGDNILLTAFGAGLASAACVIKI
ncbi:MAG: beta-ketoacyl-ACP synthase III [Clostridia bacterium]